LGALAVFIVAIVSAWARGLDIDCGCFGKGNISSNYTWLLVRDLLMLASAVYVVRSSSPRMHADKKVLPQ
jgi:uncharacterized membrane protein YkgB